MVTFASVCTLLENLVLLRVKERPGQRFHDPRDDGGSQSLQNTRNTMLTDFLKGMLVSQGPSLEEKAETVACILILLAPTLDIRTSNRWVTATSLRDIWTDAIRQFPLFTFDAIPPQSLEAVKNWPEEAAEESIFRVRHQQPFALGKDRNVNSTGMLIADLSHVLSALCPFPIQTGVSKEMQQAATATRTHAARINPGSTLTSEEALRYLQQIRSARDRPAIVQSVLTFMTNSRNTDLETLPWGGEWKWFVRLILRRMYTHMQEHSVLLALHPMAPVCAQWQHDVYRIARYYVSPTQSFPHNPVLGVPFRPMLASPTRFLPLMPYYSDIQWMTSMVRTANRQHHRIVHHADGVLLFRHADMPDVPYIDLDTLDSSQTPLDTIRTKGCSTKSCIQSKQHSIKFTAKVLAQVKDALKLVLKPGSGFEFVLTVFNSRYEVHEYLTSDRAWDLFVRGWAQALNPSAQIICILPTRLLSVGAKYNPGASNNRGQPPRVVSTGSPEHELLDIVGKLNASIESSSPAPALSFKVDAVADKNILVTNGGVEPNALLCEEKFDGDRMQFHMDSDGKTYFFTRGSFDWSDKYKSISEDIKKVLQRASPSIRDIILDGELTVFDTDKQTHAPWGANHIVARWEDAAAAIETIMLHDTLTTDKDSSYGDIASKRDWPRFLEGDAAREWLQQEGDSNSASESGSAAGGESGTRTLYFKTAKLCYTVFDIVHLNGENLAYLPLYTRRKILEQCMQQAIPNRVQIPHQHNVRHPLDALTQLDSVHNKLGEGDANALVSSYGPL